MIIVIDTPGQLGNQLWAYSNIICLAKECQSKVIVILSNEYYDYLNIEKMDKSIIFLRKFSVRAKIVRKIIGTCKTSNYFIKRIETYVDEKAFKRNYKRSSLYLINSWENRLNKNYFIKNAEYVRLNIAPAEYIKTKAAEKISTLREKADVIVAVHIRRGDYKYFLDGKYYFDDLVYLKYLRKTKELLADRRVAFALFSNEDIEVNNFDGVKVHRITDQTPIGDMWSISLCDFIIGPVSTFSMWASFCGNTPLYFMKNAGDDISLSDFKPIVAQDVFSGQ